MQATTLEPVQCHPPDPLPQGSAEGMGFRQMSTAWVNSGEWMPMPGRCPSPWNSTEPPKKLGSGKLLTPCERMQEATLR